VADLHGRLFLSEQGRSLADEAIVTTSTVLVATWRDGLFVVSGENRDQELGTQSVRALVPDG
jgi:hypothetical protein